MQETRGILDKIKHHDKLAITVNDDCKIALPNEVLQIFLNPYKLSFYCFVFVYQGTSTYRVDLQDSIVADGQMLFALPNQIFSNYPKNEDEKSFKVVFDENTLALLPNTYHFLVNPYNINTIAFDPVSKERVKTVFSILFDLLHSSSKQQHSEIILAHLNTLLTEINSAYFQQQGIDDTFSNNKISKYIAFKLAVETHLTDQHDVQSIAEKLAMTTTSLYSVVKEFSGVSPKEWMTNRLMLEAQRKLQYSKLSVKELAYELGFNDPGYFSRAFKKSTGKSVSSYLSSLNDLSHN
ncbi:helix-turn-helix domain-containing protein [Pedobacter sp. L105]|uniref:AraC family transcriptional regulator n=1 Tax=Pedobacter sp. L105 TaxID=1641871 RepID=UPI00131DF631|nr:helix-turn-helix domain-containing protein [Pedobacter sp. L105]